MEQGNLERMQLEALITEREGMLAENKQREFTGESMAYVFNDFIAIQQEIAEKVMGYTHNEDQRKFFKQISGDYGVIDDGDAITIKEKDFNPDQNNDQFIEMIGALDWEMIDNTDRRLVNCTDGYIDNSFGIVQLSWLCSHKYDVCSAVIEVVR